MAETNHNRTGAGGDRENDPLDNKFNRDLDAALAKYSAVEPRSGLENRVLASLRAERARVPDHGWWRWTIASAITAAIILAVAVGWRSGRLSRPTIARRPAVTTQAPPNFGTRATSRSNTESPPNHAVIRRARTFSAHPLVAIASSPKLDQFPSPRPLSEQERMALDYVQRSPDEAALFAQAQMALAQREELERNALRPGAAGPSGIEKME
jgi:hypothetical protein